MLVDSLHLDRDMSHTPLFQVMFILQNIPSTVDVAPDVRLSQVDVEMGTATFDMTLSISESPDEIDASLEYNTDLWEPATIKRFLGHYRNLLESVASDPGLCLSQLSLLSDDERRQILQEWQGAVKDLPEACVHDLIEAEVARAPDAVAVVSGEDRMTYRELDARANKLAQFLVKEGVGPEIRVGICMEKTVDQVTKDADRDFWLTSSEAMEYGLVKKIVEKREELI